MPPVATCGVEHARGDNRHDVFVDWVAALFDGRFESVVLIAKVRRGLADVAKCSTGLMWWYVRKPNRGGCK